MKNLRLEEHSSNRDFIFEYSIGFKKGWYLSGEESGSFVFYYASISIYNAYLDAI